MTPSFAQTNGITHPLIPSTTNQENRDPSQEDVKPHVSIREQLILLCRRQTALADNARDMDERFANAQTRICEKINGGLNTLRLGTINGLDTLRSELLGKMDHLRLNFEGTFNQLVQTQNLQSQRLERKAETNAQGIYEAQLQMRNLESRLNELKEANNRAVAESHRRAFSPEVAPGPEVIQVAPHNPLQQPPPPTPEVRPPPPHKSARVDCPRCGINYSQSYLKTHLKTTCKGAAAARN